MHKFYDKLSSCSTLTKEIDMINPGTSGLAMLMNAKASRTGNKTKVLKVCRLSGCSYSPLS